MQAISGAGYPGVASMDIMGNVVPFIGGEEEKMEQETQKILGDFARRPHRAAGRQGQRALQSRRRWWTATPRRCRWSSRRSPPKPTCGTRSRRSAAVPQERELPSAPPQPVIYMEEANRPQPRKDAERERGMAAFVGRLRACPVLDYKFVVLSHNTIRGAAGAAVLNAELMHSEGMLD